MRALLTGSLLIVSACGAIVGLEDPRDEAVPTLAAEAGADGPSVAPRDDASSGTDAPTSDAPIDAPKDVTAPPLCQADGLIGRWMFDEGAGLTAYDCTSGKHDGSIKGAQWTTGKIGSSALVFDNDSVDVGNPQAFQLTGAMTLTAWINIDSGSTSSGRIISKSSQGDRGWEINIEDGFTLEFKIATDVSSYAQLSNSITQNAWHHVAGAYAPGNTAMRLYIDGTLVQSRADAPTVGRNTSFNVLLGAMPMETGDRFEGRLDDLRIYNRALSTADVQAVMNEK